MDGRLLVVGNWKMRPARLPGAKKIYQTLIKEIPTIRGVDVVVCPPAIYLSELRALYRGKRMSLGGQHVHWESEASQTGEVSVSMIKSLGATHVIVGHSERRALGETDAMVEKKVKAALREEVTPIVCVGEKERDAHGAYLTTLSQQVGAFISSLSRDMLLGTIIAYEPVWAIGKGASDANVEPRDIHEMVIFIRKMLTERFGKEVANAVPVLYGGAVESVNAPTILKETPVDGLLVGHASVVPDEFLSIVNAAAAIALQR